VSSAAAEAPTRYQHKFHGQADQVGRVRRDIARHLAGCPAADDAVLIASELAANSVMHSASAGEFFTVRCETHPGYIWIEVEDLGGPWQPTQPDGRPHGLDIITALAGPDNWGADTTSDGDRIVWARLDLPGECIPGPGRARCQRSDIGQLERTKRELAASLALARPDSPARVPILAHMTVIDIELAGRAGRDARQP
jgi:hypothetical protein